MIFFFFSLFKIPLSGIVDCLEFSPDNSSIVATSDPAVVVLGFDPPTPQPTSPPSPPTPPRVVCKHDLWVSALHICQELIVSGSSDGDLKIVDFSWKIQ